MKKRKETNPFLGCFLFIIVLIFALYTMANIGKMEKEFDKRYLPHEQNQKRHNH